MDEESSSSSVATAAAASAAQHQSHPLPPSDSGASGQQQTSSSSSPSSSDSSATTADAQKNQDPSTSTTPPPPPPAYCPDEAVEFGYTDVLPFAPWRRKRYGLTVQGLHEEIVDMYHWIKPNEIESRLRTKVYEKVRASVLRKWKHKNIKISMFGSLRTNLFLPTSDIDVLVECDDWTGTHIDQQEWLKETAAGLEDDDIAESVMVYGGAFVPIVKMVDRDTRLSIDISFNTVQGVRAASYIGKVKEEFPLIEPLVLLLKQFLHYRNLNQTFTGGLSSYGLVLLLVNFFQLYALNMRHRTIYDRGVNLGHLLLRFLELYSLEFNFEEVGISPGQACYVPKSVAGARYGQKRAQPGNLALEDPLLTANDVGRSTYNFSSIANAFGQALQILMVAVTLRERKGRNQLARKVYRGSLLHLIMPFTSKELGYRTWLMSSALSLPRHEMSVTYDLNQLHNTLVSPIVDLSRYAWLRTVPVPIEKEEETASNGLQPAQIKNQVLAQLKEQLMKKEQEELLQELLKKGETTPTAGAPSSAPSAPRNHVEDLSCTGPPLPVSTASVNTSATVSTAASISEREDTDSPGLASSLGTPSSEDDEDGGDQRKGSASQEGTSTASGASKNSATQFKKPFNEVVAASSSNTKEHSKRTQTNFEERKMMDDMHHGTYLNGYTHPSRNHYHHQYHPHHHHQHQHQHHHHHHHQNFHHNGFQSYRGPNVFIDYAAAASSANSAGNSNGGGRKQSYGQRNHQRHVRHSSQGSNESDGYHHGNQWNNRWHGGGSSSSSTGSNPNNNGMGSSRGRARSGRGTSASSTHSRRSSESRSRGRGGFPAPASLIASYTTSSADASNDQDSTLTGAAGEEATSTNTTITQDGCQNIQSSAPRMYADAVKKKTSNATADAMNGNSGGGAGAAAKNAPPPQQQPTPPSPVSNPVEVSYRNIVANIIAKPVSQPPVAPPLPHYVRKENECALLLENGKGGVEIGHLQPQLVTSVTRAQR